jgi:hypothetical protein
MGRDPSWAIHKSTSSEKHSGIFPKKKVLRLFRKSVSLSYFVCPKIMIIFFTSLAFVRGKRSQGTLKAS